MKKDGIEQRKRKARYIIGMLCAIILMMTAAFATAQQTNFDPENYNPRFEIGLGGSASLANSIPDWSSEHDISGRLTLVMRIAYGLAIEGGKHIGYGQELDNDWFDYGPHYRLNANHLPYTEGSWMGLRFEVPMKTMRWEFFNIHSILLAGGMVWDTYNIRGDIQEYYQIPYGYRTGETPEIREGLQMDNVADMNGYYIGAAARWRLNPQMTLNPDSWYGHYGVDLGVRYYTYNKISLAHDTLMEPPSGFSAIQLFINLYFKIDLLF